MATITAVKSFIVQAPGGINMDSTVWIDGIIPLLSMFSEIK